MVIAQLSESLDRIWRARVNQKIELALVDVASIKTSLGLAPDELCSKSFELSQTLEPQIFLMLGSIEASLLRAQKRTVDSLDALSSLEKLSPKVEVLHSFHFHFERALSHFLVSDWSLAVEHFLRATALAKNDLQKAACLTNLILNYENLGLPYHRSLNEVRVVLASLDGTLRWGIESQLDALAIRQKFRTGEEVAATTQTKLSQATYLTAYFNSLPYFKSALFDSGAIENLARLDGTLINRAYRVGTLAGHINADDSMTIRKGDQIERVYLWLWRWMTQPESFPVSKVIHVLSEINITSTKVRAQLTVDEQTFLANTLRWLAYFDRNTRPILDRIVQTLNISPENKTLASERVYQELLRAKVAGDSIRRVDLELEWQNQPERIRDSFARSLPELTNAIDLKSSVTAESCVAVDRAAHTIQSIAVGSIRSESLTRVLVHLKNSPSTTPDAVMMVAFGIPEYDEFVHQPKISNLLSRLNQIFGIDDLKVSQRGSRVQLMGDSNRINVLRVDRRIESLVDDLQWRELVRQWSRSFGNAQQVLLSQQKNKASALTMMKLNFTREDIQRELKISKSKAQRMIADWIESGLVTRSGQGRNIWYTRKQEVR